MKISDELIEFIKKEACLDDVTIDFNTKIEEELGITGDDIDDFIYSFSKNFKVDISEFDAGKYFCGEGDNTIISVINYFLGKDQARIKRNLVVGDLQKAINAGELNDRIIEEKD